MSGGGNKVMLARTYTDLQTQVHEISPGSGRKIAYKRLDRAKGKPTIVLVPGHHDKFGMNGARQKALLRLDILLISLMSGKCNFSGTVI